MEARHHSVAGDAQAERLLPAADGAIELRQRFRQYEQVPREVAEAALAHVVKDSTEAAGER